MERADYVKLFAQPDDYILPTDEDLHSNTQYPNLNSKEFRLNQYNKKSSSPELEHGFYETFAINDEGELILAANNIRDRIWSGLVKGYKQINYVEEIGRKPCFKTQCDSPVTNLRYIKATLFLVTTANGTVELWSPKSEVRNIEGYCLFMIGSRNEHSGVIWSMDTFDSDTKAVTGSNDCSLKIWDIGADLSSINTMYFAHSDNITGISSLNNCEQIFATCSTDKSALIWDCRQIRPATALYEDNLHAFTAICWTKDDEKNGQVILGDETGRIYCVDPKMPNKILSSYQFFDRPIRKIRFQGQCMGLVGNTTVVKVFKFKNDNIGDGDCQLIYENSNSKDLVRDLQWNKNVENEFYTVSWDSKFNKHKINI